MLFYWLLAQKSENFPVFWVFAGWRKIPQTKPIVRQMLECGLPQTISNVLAQTRQTLLCSAMTHWCIQLKYEPLMTKPTKWHVCPAKTLISLGIRQVRSESSLSAWRKLRSLASHWAHSEDSDQTWRTCHFVGFVLMRLIWVIRFFRHQVISNCIIVNVMMW